VEKKKKGKEGRKKKKQGPALTIETSDTISPAWVDYGRGDYVPKEEERRASRRCAHVKRLS